MKKAILLIFITCTIAYGQERLTGLDNQLKQIKSQSNAETIGIVFNPAQVDLRGEKVTVKTVALPATNGPALIQNLRAIMNKVDAIYLVKGQNVTTKKLAKYVVKSAEKKKVKVYTNDPELSEIPGLGLIQVAGDGSVAVQYSAE
ncbi:MAG: hypothetical protein QNK37_07610 [Acidobacteriota bacterium]|nr:hypothetical protein [Acidobacteriota bacterium]